MNMENPSGSYIHSRPIQWGDTDAAQIAYTVRFFDFCMEAIEGWFRDVVGKDWFVLNVDDNIGTPFVNINIDLKAPLTPRHCLDTHVYVEKLGSASLSFRLLGVRSDEVMAFDAQFTCCFVDNQNMKPLKIPPEFRLRMEKFIEAGGLYKSNEID